MNRWERAGMKCEQCGSITNLTKHHIKDAFGVKNGETQILCRRCHNEVEEEYRREGRLIPFSNKKRHPMFKADAVNDVIPFFMKPTADRGLP